MQGPSSRDSLTETYQGVPAYPAGPLPVRINNPAAAGGFGVSQLIWIGVGFVLAQSVGFVRS